MKKHLLALLIVSLSTVSFATDQMSIQDFLQRAPKEAEPQGSTRLLAIRGGVIRQLAYTSVRGAASFATLGGNPSDNSALNSLLNTKMNAFSAGTAAAKNAPASGNASATEVVLGSDTRLTDARPPTAHSQDISTVNGLQTALDAKLSSAHTQGIDTVTGLQSVLDAKLPMDNPAVTGTITAVDFATTAADGDRMFECANSGAMTTTGLTTANAGRFCYDQTLAKFRYWNGTDLADMGGGASTIAGLSDWPSGVSAIEAGFLDGVTSPIQAQIDGIVAGSSGFVPDAPIYSNSACTKGQWSLDTTYHYDCVATNTWKAIVYGTNPLGTAPAFASINLAAKAAGPNTPGTGLSAPDSPNYINSYYYYSAVTAPETGVIGNAHWNMYSNGATAASKMEVYSSDGATLVCATSSVTGSASTNQSIDATFSGCSVNSGTTYLVGVCVTGDGTQYNGPYVQTTTAGPATKRVQIPCDGTAFNAADTGINISVSTTRPIYAWGDNSATR